MTRVLVVDDHPLFRDGVVAALLTAEDLDVVGEAATSPRQSRRRSRSRRTS